MASRNYGAIQRGGNPFDEDLDDDPRGFGGLASQNQGHKQESIHGISDAISTNIFKVNNHISTLERSLKQLGTSKDSRQLRDKIHTLEKSTNSIIVETTKSFKNFASHLRKADKQTKIQYDRLKYEFEDTLTRYQKTQKKIAYSVKSAPPLPAEPKPAPLVDFGTEQKSAQQESDRLLKHDQLQAQELEVDNELEMLHQREEEIRQLEANMLDINDIFKTLGTMVHEQGELVNSIEDNVETAYSNVESGTEQLRQAEVYQRKARKKLCYLIIILTVIGAVLGLVIYLAVK